MAFLESKHTRISVELEATRDALASPEKEKRTFSGFSRTQLVDALKRQTSAHTSLVYERKLRGELLASFGNKIPPLFLRCRSVRKSVFFVLAKELDTERFVRNQAQAKVADLVATLSNGAEPDGEFTISKSCLSMCNEEEICRPRNPAFDPQRSSSYKGSVDNAKTTTQLHQRTAMNWSATQPNPTYDNIRSAQARSAVSEERCRLLTDRVACLQRNINLCVDSCSQALEVERELR